MECAVCKKNEEEIQLYEGILDNEVVKVCKTCADLDNIPIIRKPSQEQLKKADTNQSVRERMERLSGSRRPVTDIGYDQSIVQSNIARLRMPANKQHHPDVQDNYYWELNIARRRKKLSIVQVAQITGIPTETIRAIEQGQIPAGFEQIFLKLESFLGIKLLKDHKRDLMFRKPGETERRILQEVEQNIGKKIPSREEKVLSVLHEHNLRDKKEKVDLIKHGEADFSNRDRLRNVSVRDLAEIKRSKELLERRLKEKKTKEKKAKEETIMGDDIDLEAEDI
ncbi:MAG: helix-turn-helix domain-containing protein [Candidatus Nanoarchaeia archaeon]